MYCPYCGKELEPIEDTEEWQWDTDDGSEVVNRDEWMCEACDKVFEVRDRYRLIDRTIIEEE